MKSVVPRHIGIIMDGNRRWAARHAKEPIEGHKAGYKTLIEISKALKNRGVDYLSVYAFSSENWNRPDKEVRALMNLVKYVLTEEIKKLVAEDIRLRIIGSKNGLDKEIAKLIKEAEKQTAANKGGTLVVCFNYGAKQEIADAATKAFESGKSKIEPQDITDNLYMPQLPPLDLLIRTGGEKRLSNYMLWQSAYAELLFVDKLWPDFSSRDLDVALKEYTQRQRRFGH